MRNTYDEKIKRKERLIWIIHVIRIAVISKPTVMNAKRL